VWFLRLTYVKSPGTKRKSQQQSSAEPATRGTRAERRNTLICATPKQLFRRY
jgi:hypothetical protein